MVDTQLLRFLEKLVLLMEIAGENEFRIRSYSTAIRVLESQAIDIHSAVADGSLASIRGIGKTVFSTIQEYIQTGSLREYNDLAERIPAGVVQMTELRGVGAKKAKALYEQLGITSIGELEYACKENRLVALKGFGEKTQQSIYISIEHWNAAKGKTQQHKAWAIAKSICSILEEHTIETVVAGELRRACEIITTIRIVARSSVIPLTLSFGEYPHENTATSTYIRGFDIPVEITWAGDDMFAIAVFHATGSQEFVNELCASLPVQPTITAASEEEIFTAYSLPNIIPELRDDSTILSYAITPDFTDAMEEIIDAQSMKGMLHVHTTWSDGANSVREMALAAKEHGFSYIAICDHSRTAVYARGLTIERVLQQHEEIERLNEENLGITILKGIESDILGDGSLDYPDDILELFDVVVASVHSQFRLPKDEQTLRLIRAVENPYTTILGHPTGRLLLARSGYELDIEAVLLAAANSGTSIEVNANPYRFDLDRQWHRFATENGVKLAINPDSHSVHTLDEVFLGVNLVRKSMISRSDILNTMPLSSFMNFTRNLRMLKLSRH